MPINGSVGQSEYTETKQQHFAAVIKTHLKIAKGVMSRTGSYPGWIKPNYLYIDFYAGCGSNVGDIKGSPVIFLEQARSVGINNTPIFIEENEYSANLLSETLLATGANNFEVLACDNADFVKDLLKKNGDKKYFGLAYLDPNGIPDFELIRGMSNLKQYDKFDFLVNCPATAIKRAMGNQRCKQNSKLIDEILSINKSYWIVREPIGKYQWTFLIGTNWNSFPKFKNLGFHPLSSPEGRDIIMQLSYTATEIKQFKEKGWYTSYPEYLKHPFFKIVRKESMANARGSLKRYKKWGAICQECKSEFATEVHHLVYPPWNTFDVPENLHPVCHKCHCSLHDKED